MCYHCENVLTALPLFHFCHFPSRAYISSSISFFSSFAHGNHLFSRTRKHTLPRLTAIHGRVGSRGNGKKSADREVYTLSFGSQPRLWHVSDLNGGTSAASRVYSSASSSIYIVSTFHVQRLKQTEDESTHTQENGKPLNKHFVWKLLPFISYSSLLLSFSVHFFFVLLACRFLFSIFLSFCLL